MTPNVDSHRIPDTKLHILVIPESEWAKPKQEAEEAVDWTTHDVPSKHASELLTSSSLKNLVYPGDPNKLRLKRRGFTALLVHEKVRRLTEGYSTCVMG